MKKININKEKMSLVEINNFLEEAYEAYKNELEQYELKLLNDYLNNLDIRLYDFVEKDEDYALLSGELNAYLG